MVQRGTRTPTRQRTGHQRWISNVASRPSEGGSPSATVASRPSANSPTTLLVSVPRAIRAHFEGTLAAAVGEYRAKVAFIRPSSSGKTSLLKRLIANEAAAGDQLRRIGIDTYPWRFDAVLSKGSTNTAPFHVTVWDFGGHEVYRPMHAIFFTARTLFVLCVNLKAYATAMLEHGVVEGGDGDASMEAFFEENIDQWIRGVCACEPDAAFVFVGTHFDMIGNDDELVAKIGNDLIARVERREKHGVQHLNKAIMELQAELRVHEDTPCPNLLQQLRSLEYLKSHRPRFVSADVVVASSMDPKGVSSVYQWLQNRLVESECYWRIPPVHSQLGDFLRTVVGATPREPIKTRVERAFVGLPVLSRMVAQDRRFTRLSDTELSAMLQVLHNLNDILLLESGTGSLSDMLLLSPALLIDLAKEIMNHKLTSELYTTKSRANQMILLSELEAVRRDGLVTHDLLTKLNLWSEIDDDQAILRLKMVFLHFRLAYPVGPGGMLWNSDMIIPAYWEKRNRSDGIPATGQRANLLGSKHVCWEYDFHEAIPEQVFHMLAVQCYSAFLAKGKQFTRYRFEINGDQDHITVTKVDGLNGAVDQMLRIKVSAETQEVAWNRLVWICICLERLLNTHPSLWTRRYVTSLTGARFEVDKLLMQRKAIACGQVVGSSTTEGSLHDDSNLLPPSMEWYTKKLWRVDLHADHLPSDVNNINARNADAVVDAMRAEIRSALSSGEAELHKHIEDAKQDLFNLIASSGNQRDYPALWTLEYKNDEKKLAEVFVLKMRSQLSGNCYHEPILIKVGANVFNKYGVVIKTGLTLFGSVVPNVFGTVLVNRVISAGRDEVGRTMKVHSLVQGLDLPEESSIDMASHQSLSPDETVVLLRELLTVYDPSFEPMKMSKLSGLECGIVRKTGECLWAHRTEIQARIDEIQFRHNFAADFTASNINSPLSMATTAPEVFEKAYEHQNVDASRSEGVVPMKREAIMHEICAKAKLQIVGVENLRRTKTLARQSPFCKWTLFSPSGQELLSDQTAKDEHEDATPNWTSQLFELTYPHSEAMKSLEGYTFFFSV